MIIRYENGDQLHFPNIPEEEPAIKPPAPALQAWVRDKKGNWVTATSSEENNHDYVQMRRLQLLG